MIICKICGKTIKSMNGLTNHVSKTHNLLPQDYYDRYFRNYARDEGFCETCGKETNFKNMAFGYVSFCDGVCVSKNKKIRRKIQKAVKRSYQRDKEGILEKKKETCIKNWGVDSYFKSDIYKEVMKELTENNGGIHPAQTKEAQEKRKNTCIKNLGFENPSFSPAIIDKIKKTKEENGHSEEQAKLKRENTMLSKYGVKYYNNREQSKKTCINKYGVDNPSKVKEIKESKQQQRLNNFKNDLDIYLKELNLKLLDKDYKGAHFKHNWLCLKCNNQFAQIWNSIQQEYLCPTCFPRNSGKSLIEEDIINFVKSIYPNKIHKNNRKIIPPKELDIYLPDINIAIEFDGLFWHSDINGKSKNYHLNKTRDCLKKNIFLIHIFEDEWIYKKEIVKSRLRQILNLNNNNKIYARKCVISEISPKIKNDFLEDNHLQGKDSSTIKLGAFYEDNLISVMTFSKGNISKGSKAIEGIWELNRFCSKIDYNIPGIASKFLKYFQNNYDWSKIYSYADRRWSNGNLYESIGFELDKITEPNYWYVNQLRRIHRFNLRKRPDEPKDIPEWILRRKEGYFMIWDCGHYKYILENNQRD